MPWWVKASGAFAAILFLVDFGTGAVARRPTADDSLVRVALYLVILAIVCAYMWLRAVRSRDRLKVRRRAWWTDRREARRRYHTWRRRRVEDDDDDD